MNTLMTLWPFIRSSTNPVMSARSICCRMKYFPLLPVTTLDTRVMTPIISTAITVRIGLKASMEINVTMIVNADMSTCGMDWLIIWRRVSVSFV